MCRYRLNKVIVSFGVFLLVLILSLENFRGAIVTAVTEEENMNQAAVELHRLFEAEWDYQMEQNPIRASMLGDRRWNNRWPDVSLDAIQKRHDHNLAVLAKLKSIDRSKLSAEDRLNYDLFNRNYTFAVEEHQYRWYLAPLSQQEGIQVTPDEMADSLRFETLKDYEDWIARVRSFPTYMEQTIALMRDGIRARMLLPKVIMQRVPAQLDKLIVTRPEESSFYRPFKQLPPSIPQDARNRLTADVKDAITQRAVPAFKRLRGFFTAEYLPASFDEVGIWQVPRGAELYTHFIRSHTTTDLGAAQIHELGLKEVERIRSEMTGVMKRVGFKGTYQQFLTFLRTDPRFYYKTPEELLAAYRAMSKRIDPQLIKVFRKLPRMPYGVEPIPDNIAPDTTTAYYREPAADGSRAGTYFVNLYKPEARPKWEMMALSIHEAVPGHHLQLALAMEQSGLPKFRRFGGGGYTAFVEGWALYAESLGDEMGLYDDPYSKFGQLTYEMWRAVRLVVDTGIHAKRWDRQKAIDFFLQNAAKQELDVTNEIDRYIAWPGQALAYKIGQLKIKELRSRSEKSLRDAFDLREFHEVVLSAGGIPLDILAQNVDAWVASKKRD